MKKILFFLLLINSVVIYSQTPIRLPSKTVRQTWNGDTAQVTVNTDSVNYHTNTSRYSFDKPVYVQGALIGGGSETFASNGLTKDGDTIKLGGNAENPIIISNVAGDFLFNLYPYFFQIAVGQNNVNGGCDAILDSSGWRYVSGVDTSLFTDNHLITKRKLKDELYRIPAQVRINTKAIEGSSTNSNGVYGYSINAPGVEGASNNSIGGRFGSNYDYGIEVFSSGHSIANFNNGSGDSIIFEIDGTIHQYRSGVEVFKTDIVGNITASSLFMDDGFINNTLTNYGMTITNPGLSQTTIESDLMGIDDAFDSIRFTSHSIETPSKILHNFDIGHLRINLNNDAITKNYAKFDSSGLFEQWHSGIKKIYTDTSGWINSFTPYAVARADSISYSVGGTQNIFYKINTGALAVKDSSSGVTVRGDSVQIKYAGDYDIWYSMAATTSNANDKIRVRLYVNNDVASPALGRWIINSQGTGAAQTENCPFWYHSIPAGAWLSLRVVNQTGSRAISITDYGLNIKLRHK